MFDFDVYITKRQEVVWEVRRMARAYLDSITDWEDKGDPSTGDEGWTVEDSLECAEEKIMDWLQGMVASEIASKKSQLEDRVESALLGVDHE